MAPSTPTKKPSSKTGANVCTAIAVVVGLAAIRLATNNWLTIAPRAPSDFPGSANLEVLEIPVRYYTNLSELNDFIEDFVVLRAANKFVIEDIDGLLGSEMVRTKVIDPACKRESVICSPCFKDAFSREGVAFTNVSQVMKPGSGMYASFAKISNEGATKMWNLMGSSFAVSNTSLEHAFISNLDTPMITAPFHAASTLLSMSVQLMGRKTWLFIDRYEYINNWGGIPAAGVVLPQRAPAKKLKVYVYTGEPGDILFFPATYAHAVYTHSGQNLMVNYRKLIWESFYGQPVTFSTGLSFAVGNKLVEQALGRFKKRHADDKAPILQPEQGFNKIAYAKLDAACEAMDGKSLPIDDLLVNLLKHAAAKATAQA